MKWISWFQPTDDHRPIIFPPTECVLAWWKTGDSDEGAMLVALVDADSEDVAKEYIQRNWPEAKAWRFCDDKEDRVFSERFPVEDWMTVRGCSNSSIQKVHPMSMALNKQALREVAEKVTALNLDTAQLKRGEDESCECPVCCGEGYVDVERDYCNIDGAALGVLFYGIGEHHGVAEEYFRAANPATVLALLDEIEELKSSCKSWAETAINLGKRISEMGKSIDPESRAAGIKIKGE